MLIGIEAERANAPQKTGVEHYAKQLITHLAQIDGQNQYVLYLRSRPQDWFLALPGNFKIKVMPFPVFWTQLRVSLEMLLHPPDVLLIPASALPIVHPKKSYVTIHDLAWKYYPETFDFFNRWFLNWSTGFAARRASRVIAVSQATRQDLVKFYGIKADKISVVHHGYDPEIISAEVEVPLPRTLPQNYILFISTLQPRKNLQGLIEAFEQLKAEQPEIPHKLVVVGRPGWKYEPILESIRKHSENVIHLSQLTDEQRNAVLHKANLLVLPSFYEGFGMTILEAFAAKIPVAVSNISSMPEVAGQAAIYFDPHDLASIKTALRQALIEPGLSERLVLLGQARLADFSWTKTAQKTLKIITQP